MKLKTVQKLSYKKRLSGMKSCPQCRSKLFWIDEDSKACSSCAWNSFAMESMALEPKDLSVIRSIDKQMRISKKSLEEFPYAHPNKEAQKNIA